MKNSILHLFSLLAAYVLLLAWNGYIYGHGDMIEILPYAKWLTDNTLYTQDFFIQHISAQNINERIALAYFFSLFKNEWMPIVALLLHALSGLFLLEGLFRIGKMFIRAEGVIWIAILVPFTILFNWNLGGNEMYIPLVTSSTLAKAIGIWAIYFFLRHRMTFQSSNDFSKENQPSKKISSKIKSAFGGKSSDDWKQLDDKKVGENIFGGKSLDDWKSSDDKKNWFVFILLSIATLIQPLVGLQLFLILSGILVLNVFFEKKIRVKSFLPILFYVFTGGLWIFFITRHFAEGEIDNQLFFEFVEFRIPHHFIPSYFSKKAALVLLPLFGGSLIFYYKKNRDLFLFFVITLLGLAVFVVAVEFLQVSSVVSSQWFKTTIWLKSLSVIALFSFLEKKIAWMSQDVFSKISLWGLRILGVLSIFLIVNPVAFFQNKTYDFFFLNKKNPAIEIAQIAKNKTPKDALFIIPASNTHFKTYSERSTYIDYKAVIHRKSVIPIWYKRIQEIYEVNLETRLAGKDVVATADENFKALSIQDLKAIKLRGVHYLLTFKEVDLPFDRVGENAKYIIYKL